MAAPYRYERSATYKWCLLHDDDDPSEALWFKSKGDALFHLMCVSGYDISEVKQ